MTSSTEMQRKLHSAYSDFVQTAERKRHWSVYDDIPWDAIDGGQGNEEKAILIETFCLEELYVPDYCARGVELMRPWFGLAWFQINWSAEEAKHGLALREYLIRSGLRSEADFDALWSEVFAKPWSLPFSTAREMSCYGAIQEAATYAAYQAQKLVAAEAGDAALEAIFSHISRDEAAHAGFYRTVIAIHLDEDRVGTIADLAHVLSHFRMPGDERIPNYRQRLQEGGGGISARSFLQRAVLATLRSLGLTRDDLRGAPPREQLRVAVA